MTLETLENFLFLLLWIEVFAMAIGLLLLDRSMSRNDFSLKLARIANRHCNLCLLLNCCSG